MSIIRTLYDTMPDGTDVYLYTIENVSGTKAGVITKGATLNSLCCADRDGNVEDILAGFDTIEGHLNTGTYAGCIVGQVGNRVCGGRFTLGGKTFDLTKNEKGRTCLHGGGEYSSAIWKAIIVDDNAVEFSYSSPDGKEGFPGNVDITVRYVLTDKNELEIHYTAVSDADTVINPTNHSYFNLATVKNGDVLSQEIKLYCSHFTPTDAI